MKWIIFLIGFLTGVWVGNLFCHSYFFHHNWYRGLTFGIISAAVGTTLVFVFVIPSKWK